jgi:hypothetical protein
MRRFPAPLPLTRPLALFLLAGGAAAQDVNIDFGTAFGTPSPAHGGAAGQPGPWNPSTGAWGETIRDTQGNPVALQLTLGFFFNTGPFASDDSSTSGDAGALLDDGWSGCDAVVLDGLQAGFYSLYAYTWTPQAIDAKVVVDAYDTAPAIEVGGLWTGAYEPGITHAVLDVFVPQSPGPVWISLDNDHGGALRTCVNALQVVRHEALPAPTIYCAPSPNSLGCPSSWNWLGVPSGPAEAPFALRYGPVPGAELGLLLYTTAGAAAVPAQTVFGELCLQQGAIFRTPSVDLGGTSGTCDGALAFDFNAFADSQTADPTLVPGATVDLQAWYRDPPNAGGANLSQALRFTLLP